jgi:hypothetical protein
VHAGEEPFALTTFRGRILTFHVPNIMIQPVISEQPGRELRSAYIMMFDIQTFTLIHVVISLLGIASGFVVIFGMIAGRRLNALTAFFLATTIATSVTGFGFPITGVTPGIVLGVISLVVLAVALSARYGAHLAGAWRLIYVITAVMAQYLNFFVLIVQSFQKVPALKALAPTQAEPPFAIAQAIALIAFIVLGVLAGKKFRVLPQYRSF